MSHDHDPDFTNQSRNGATAETVTTACTCGIRWTVPYTADGLGGLSLAVEAHTAENPTHSAAVEVEHLGDDH